MLPRALCGSLLLIALLISLPVHAEREARPLRDALAKRMAEKTAPSANSASVIADVAYGSHPAHRYDVYLPATPPQAAPVIFMVHGGGWRHGDKEMSRTVTNKTAAFTKRGWIVISTNYRMIPDADPLEQASDIGRAVAHAQQHAKDWGGDKSRFVLMGHSAGAHLVALVSAKPELASDHGALAWLATIGLDSGGYDVERIMNGRHMKLYDDAFGSDPAFWRAASPVAQLSGGIAPFLAVCSTQRTVACAQANIMRDAAQGFGSTVEVLPVDLSHGEINDQLGLDTAYTQAVIDFLKRHAGL